MRRSWHLGVCGLRGRVRYAVDAVAVDTDSLVHIVALL